MFDRACVRDSNGHDTQVEPSHFETTYIDPRIGEKRTQDEVGALEITYVDPRTSHLQRKNVFCDAADWKERYQARLLVSSDLVNLLNEAREIWHGRFWETHLTLERNRFIFFCGLWYLRRFVERLAGTMLDTWSATPTDTDSVEKDKEVCPVHFYLPDFYLDPWTCEHLLSATQNFKEEINSEIESINERINIIGGGTWRQLIAFFLKQGSSSTKIVKSLMVLVKDESERRSIQNKITQGLCDEFDELQSRVTELTLEDTDCKTRWMTIDNLGRRALANISELAEKSQSLLDRLNRPPEKPSAEELAAKIEEAHRLFMVKLASKAQAARAEFLRAEKLVAEWEARLGAIAIEDLEGLKSGAQKAKHQTRMMQIQCQRLESKTEETDKRTRSLNEAIAKNRGTLEEFREKLGNIPAASDAALRYKRLQREYKNLKKEEAAIQKAMNTPFRRVKALRSHLKRLYKRLEWDWDCSESDDSEDEEDKPYWQRRQLAKDAGLPFDMGHFLAAEQENKSRRLSKLAKKQKGEEEAKTRQTMIARRTLCENLQEDTSESAGLTRVERAMIDLLNKTGKAKASDTTMPFSVERPSLAVTGAGPEDDAKPRTGWNGLRDRAKQLKYLKTQEEGEQGVVGPTQAPSEGGSGMTGSVRLQEKRARIVKGGGQDVAEPYTGAEGMTRKSSLRPEARLGSTEKASQPHAQPLPDTTDPVDNALTVVRRRLTFHLEGVECQSISGSSSTDALSSGVQSTELDEVVSDKPPWWAHCPEELKWRCTHLIQLQRLRDAFEAQLLDCVQCFVNLLQRDGNMESLRLRLLEMIEVLQMIPTNPCVWQEDEVDRQLEDVGACMQRMVEEAITYGEQVDPIKVAMRHSVAIGELRRCLGEVVQGERRLRCELRAVAELEKLVGRQPRARVAPTRALAGGVHRRERATSLQKSSTAAEPAQHPKSAPARGVGEELGGSLQLRMPTKLKAGSGPLFCGQAPKPQAKEVTSPKRAEFVNFGFRPDGIGEGSIENWSLFKVSKGPFMTSASEASTTCDGFSNFSGRDKFRSTMSRIDQYRTDCGFHEYMSATATTASTISTSRSMSMPILAQKKRGFRLPELINSRDCSYEGNRRSSIAAGEAGHVAASMKQRGGASGRSSKYGKFRATAPPGALFERW